MLSLLTAITAGVRTEKVIWALSSLAEAPENAS
jgi:hypothetical protein